MRTVEEINQEIHKYNQFLNNDYNKFTEYNQSKEIKNNQLILFWLNWVLGEEHFNNC